jgi:hypothetical protein
MFEVSDEELAAESIRLTAVLPDLQERIGKLNGALDAKVQHHIAEGTLTPELALAFWFERMARQGLVKSLLTRVAVNNMAK